MFQSHLLQVLTLVAMESPARFTADPLRNEKMKVLDAIAGADAGGGVPRRWSSASTTATGSEPGVPAGVEDADVRGGAAAGRELAGGRGCRSTCAAGKGLKSRYSEVMIQFRCPPHLMFPLPPGEMLQCNRLTMVLQPNEGIHLNFQTKVPDVDGVRLQPRDLSFDYKEAYAEKPLPEAYERLLLDAIQGDASLFMRSDEIERAWEIMDPIIAATERPDAPEPEQYAGRVGGPGVRRRAARRRRPEVAAAGLTGGEPWPSVKAVVPGCRWPTTDGRAPVGRGGGRLRPRCTDCSAGGRRRRAASAAPSRMPDGTQVLDAQQRVHPAPGRTPTPGSCRAGVKGVSGEDQAGHDLPGS